MTILPNSLLQQIYFIVTMSKHAQKNMSHYVLQTISIRGENGHISEIINFTLTKSDALSSEDINTESTGRSGEDSRLCSEEEEDQNSSQKHMCNKCCKPFRYLQELKKHLVSCQFDGGYHLRKAEMMKNIEKIEKDSAIMDNNNICFCCGESYKTFHLGQINCLDCPKSFKTQMSYEQHVFITHSESDEFPCSVCNAKLRSSFLLKLHEKQHKSFGRPFVCKICSKDFGRIDHLKRHQKYTNCSASAIDVISCKLCKKDFSRPDNLRKHILSVHHLCVQVTKKNRFICPICKNSFHNLWNLNRHKRTHTGERPFACDLCEKKYPSMDALKTHRRLHTGEKPYKCTECNQCFINKKALNRHLMRHVCNICGQHFTKVIHLRCHNKTHMRPLACHQCHERFKTVQQLDQHSQIHSLEDKFKYNKYKTPYTFYAPKYTNSGPKGLEKEQTNCDINVKDFASIKALNSHILDLYQQNPENFRKSKFTQKVKLNSFDSLPTKIYRFDNFYDNITTTNNNAMLPMQFIVDEVDEKEQLSSENEEYCVLTLEDEIINNSPETAVPESTTDAITENRISIDSNAIVQHPIKDEPPETSTEQLLSANEEYCVITLENEIINTSPKTAVPENEINAIIENRISAEGEAVVQQSIKIEPPETFTEQLLSSNEEYCAITLENETIKTESKTAVPESSFDANTDDRTVPESDAGIHHFIKVEPTETLLLENEQYSDITLGNVIIKTEPKSAVSEDLVDVIADNRISVDDCAVIQQFIKDEPTETATEQLLLEKEVCTALKNVSIKLEPECDEPAVDAIPKDSIISVEDSLVTKNCIENVVSERTTEQLLLNNELYTVITLQKKDSLTKLKTTTPENLPKPKSNIRSLAASLVAAITDTVEKEETEDDVKIKNNIRKLLDILVDKNTLTKFGWPEATEEYVLCRVIENCGYDLGKDKRSYAECDYATRMREYVKLLFSVVLHNDSILELLNYYPIDDVIKFVLDNDDNDHEKIET